MIEIDIPGFSALRIFHLVLDYNGTLAVDGSLAPGVGPALNRLASDLSIHVLTADTFGSVKTAMEGIECRVTVLSTCHHAEEKRDYVRRLGAERTAAIGNGRNDRLMLKESALGIAVILEEGLAAETLLAADVVCAGVLPALALLIHPLRMIATLRS